MTEETESRKSVAWETEDEEEEEKSEGEGGTLKVARVVPVFTAPCGHCKVGVLQLDITTQYYHFSHARYQECIRTGQAARVRV